MSSEVENIIKISPYELNGRPMVDVRYWKETRKGPRPTNKGIDLDLGNVTRLIYHLQRFHRQHSKEQAQEAGRR